LIKDLAELILQSKKILVFTGAGISTESGISDYRSKGGLWKKFQPVTIQEFLSSEEKRKEYWLIKMSLLECLEHAKPNAGHQAIVELEILGKLLGVVTQNIDGLHLMAGTSRDKIMEIHGTMRDIICLSCQVILPWEEVFARVKSGEDTPDCHACGGKLKPNTVSFGQNLDPDVLDQSVRWANECDLVIAIGSTLVVEPAASIPRIAKQNGARLAIINLSETPLDAFADVLISMGIGETFTQVMKLVRDQIPTS